MSINPWLVKNFRDYWYLNCPECTFKTKEVYNFKEHAVTNHPLSCTVFRSFIVSNSESDTEYVSGNVNTEMIKKETNEDEISDPLATLPKKGEDTGKSMSEALIFALTNPQYDNRLFIEL